MFVMELLAFSVNIFCYLYTKFLHRAFMHTKCICLSTWLLCEFWMTCHTRNEEPFSLSYHFLLSIQFVTFECNLIQSSPLVFDSTTILCNVLPSRLNSSLYHDFGQFQCSSVAWISKFEIEHHLVWHDLHYLCALSKHFF